MKIELKFEPKDFETFKNFESAIKRQVGNHVYIGSNSFCLYFDYTNDMCEKLRHPLPIVGETVATVESSRPEAK